jgi:beta-glucanase (GH16 family)
MKKSLLLSLFALALLARADAPPPPAAPTPFGDVVQGYSLAWSDEFNGAALDATNWDYRTDTKMWSAQLPQNVSVTGGNLVIDVKKEHINHEAHTGGGIISKRQFEFGYFEARFKVPPGSGWHTSFWTAPNWNVPADQRPTVRVAENDICEQDSVKTTSYSAGVIAWGNRGKGVGRKSVATPDLSADFHVWGCEFTPTRVRYFFDGKLTHEADMTKVKTGPASIWLTSIASGLGGTHYVDDRKLPATAQFDYVRYYQSTNPTP